MWGGGGVGLRRGNWWGGGDGVTGGGGGRRGNWRGGGQLIDGFVCICLVTKMRSVGAFIVRGAL